MLKSHVMFHSSNGKRLVLIADDEYQNREILRMTLESEFELLFASNGEEAIDAMRKNKNTLSLVLLDLMMPVMSGMEVLQQTREDPEIGKIPIIVITSDQQAEVESLTLGAVDFIPKPYPKKDVIDARIRRTIELSEDRRTIEKTERDEVTGLYNIEYFHLYIEMLDQHHPYAKMDALVLDVNHFHIINERFGSAYGDTILRSIAQALREAVNDEGGIVCRREADTFLVYCPHGRDYNELLNYVSEQIADAADDIHIWLRMGAYAEVDKGLDIERRFDRAKMAADTVQGSFTKRIGIYDSKLHEQELYSEQLIGDFGAAIKERQFKVYYQPKFDVQLEIPVLASAEALVRWQHPELGMISPGVFIPLFEDNGLIQQLDLYVWREVAAKIREWKTRFGLAVPVSVNVSRIDMYDPHLVDTLLEILENEELVPHELQLEITESAYTQDSEQIIETVHSLRRLGFRVEMDDFGTGYSSLNMISTLPIDVLKMDMQFIRNAFTKEGDTKMLEVIIDIADYLSIPVIAEGVETEEQLAALKEMGCDYVQGYYFSPPVPADEYEAFVIERSELTDVETTPAERRTSRLSSRAGNPIGDIAHALSSGFESIFYVDTQNGSYVEFTPEGKSENLQIEGSGKDFFAAIQKRLASTIAPEDRVRVELSMEKKALLAQLAGTDPFYMTYRTVVDGTQRVYSLKAVRTHTNDDHHIVVGISDVDAQFREAGIDEEFNELDFTALACALSSDMEVIYYVDMDTDTYLEYQANADYSKLDLNLTGEDFFGECQVGIDRFVHPDDRDMLRAALDKTALESSLVTAPVFSLSYRLMIDGEPQHYALKVVRAGGPKSRHVIIGVSNVEAQVINAERLEDGHTGVVSYTSIVQALALDYFSIYYVNAETGHFVEYSSQEMRHGFDTETTGEDFFGENRMSIAQMVHPDDREMFLSTFTRERLMSELEHGRTFTLTYRLLLGEEPMYVHLKAMRMEKRTEHIVIGISNVDEQIRREQEHAKALRMANQDALTGVKSKHAYVEAERKIDRAIAVGEQGPFAIAVCDINDLKYVNDTRGHSAGDQYIKDACKIVCNIFEHSPVYRVGGDEFVVLMQRRDYEARDALMSELKAVADHADLSRGDVVVAGGMSVFEAGLDRSLSDVFERADAAMYENKKLLKGTNGS